MTNDICKLPTGYELNIPLLKIFLIQENPKLSEISDQFTQAMKEAKVIDFEDNNIASLPKSMNQLTRLRMLNLGGNKSLRILGELNPLEILILNGTGITEIPHEIGNLVNLRLFHAAECYGLSHIAPGVLSKLHWLEELSIGYYLVEEGKYNSLVEIGKLSKLTFLNLYVPHICLFPEGDYLKRLKRFSIQIVGREEGYVGIPEGNRTLSLGTPYLDISHLMHVRKLIELCDGIGLVSIENLDKIMPMIMQSFHPTKAHEGVKENTRFLSEVEELQLFHLSKIHVLWNCPDQYISLNNLVILKIEHCCKLEKLFTVSVAHGLVNLQELTIWECDNLKEVISNGDEETSTGEKNIVFPRLAQIYLFRMLNLTSFYPGNATIKYPSLVRVWIAECNEMEKWGYGTHDTPNLQWVNGTKANGSTIDETLAKDREPIELAKKQKHDLMVQDKQWEDLLNRLISVEEGPSSVCSSGGLE
ncbi:NB-ARC domains-containing protein [Tanacetum coccineum]